MLGKLIFAVLNVQSGLHTPRLKLLKFLTFIVAAFLAADHFFSSTLCRLYTFVSDITGPCVDLSSWESSILFNRHLEFWSLRILQHHRCVLNWIHNSQSWLVRIGQRIKEWWQFLDIQDDGNCHLDFWLLCYFFDITDAFYVEFAIFPPNLVSIDQKLITWQQFVEIQDSGNRYFEFWLYCYFKT